MGRRRLSRPAAVAVDVRARRGPDATPEIPAAARIRSDRRSARGDLLVRPRHLIQVAAVVGAVVGEAAGATPAAEEEAAAEAEEAAKPTAAVVVVDRAVAEGAARASPCWWQAPH
jgi:hypothetical protein